MKGLNRTQLKIIAICAMVCDHLAWGFWDFFTPLAQVMHIIFDLLLGLTALTILEHPSFAKWQKGVLTAGVLLVSGAFCCTCFA